MGSECCPGFSRLDLNDLSGFGVFLVCFCREFVLVFCGAAKNHLKHKTPKGKKKHIWKGFEKQNHTNKTR